MMKFRIFLISFLIFCFFLSIDQVLALGVGANPSFLDLELEVSQPKEAKILIYNISQEPGIFQIFPDELNDWIKIEPNNFRLEAGENKKVKITVLAKGEGKRATNLSVLAKPLDQRSFSVSPGLKIPLKLDAREERLIFLATIRKALGENFSWLWILAGILMISLTRFFLLKYQKKRKKIVAPPENLPVENP